MLILSKQIIIGYNRGHKSLLFIVFNLVMTLRPCVIVMSNNFTQSSYFLIGWSILLLSYYF